MIYFIFYNIFAYFNYNHETLLIEVYLNENNVKDSIYHYTA